MGLAAKFFYKNTGKQKPRYEEFAEMQALAAWLDAQPPTRHKWFHPPNEGKRSAAQAARMRSIGLKPGVPDVVILRPCVRLEKRYNFCAIELKRPKKKGRRTATTSDAQLLWFAEIADSGGLVYLAHGAQEAVDFLRGITWL